MSCVTRPRSYVLQVRIQKQDLVDSVSIQSGTSLRNRAASCTERPLTLRTCRWNCQYLPSDSGEVRESSSIFPPPCENVGGCVARKTQLLICRYFVSLSCCRIVCVVLEVMQVISASLLGRWFTKFVFGGARLRSSIS